MKIKSKNTKHKFSISIKMHVLVQKNMKPPSVLLKKKKLIKNVKYNNFLLLCIIREDGDNYVGQNGAVTFVTR